MSHHTTTLHRTDPLQDDSAVRLASALVRNARTSLGWTPDAANARVLTDEALHRAKMTLWLVSVSNSDAEGFKAVATRAQAVVNIWITVNRRLAVMGR